MAELSKLQLYMSFGMVIAAAVLGLVTASPIPAASASGAAQVQEARMGIGSFYNGSTNTIVLGALAFVCVGVIFLGGCVCCRRKRGFKLDQEKDPKEFTNDNAPTEPARSEYPIFLPLASPGNHSQSSPPNSPAVLIRNQENLPHDELEPEMDNNNGPISPTDLQNIENNNAFDYIPNRNEVAEVVIEHPAHSMNRSLSNEILANAAQMLPLDTPPDYSGADNPFVDDLDDIIITIETDNDIDLSEDKCPTEEDAKGLLMDNDGQSSLNNIVAVDEEEVAEEVEANSVEEALRELDFALAGEESPQDQDEDDISLDANDPSFQNVLRQFLINNSANGLLPSPDNLSDLLSPPETDSGAFTLTRQFVEREAVSLVDNVLRECQEIVNIRNIGTEAVKTSENETEELSQPLPIIAKELDTPADSFLDVNIKTEGKKVMFKELVSEKSFEEYDVEEEEEEEEEMFSRDLMKHISSTPCASGKFVDTCNTVIPQKLFGDSFGLDEDDDFKMPASTAVFNVTDIIKNNTFERQPLIKDQLQRNPYEEPVMLMENTFEIDEKPVEYTTIKQLPLSETFKLNDVTVITVPAEMTVTNVDLDESSDNKSDATLTTVVVNTLDAKTITALSINANPETTFEGTADHTRTMNVNPENTFDVKSDTINDDKANTTFDVKLETTFDVNPPVKEAIVRAERNQPLECPVIKIDKDDTKSEDLTTITPVNTPIELNYSLDSWDKFISNSMSQDANLPPPPNFENTEDAGGWFLHPQNPDDLPVQNDTFDVMGEPIDEPEENEETMNLTFEALRKQLAECLPHAQGMTGPAADYSDDEDSHTPNERTFDEYRSPLEGLLSILDEPGCSTSTQPHTEMVINYKPQLSPIMEESEDETCRTFIMNETRLLDSTSTGIMETGEAIMGVTKTLMASNDTLFNFDDTLGEREDLFSPRATSQQDVLPMPICSSDSQTPTPTNDIASKSSDIDSTQRTSSGGDLNAQEVAGEHNAEKERLFEPLDFGLTKDFAANDLCSPDQQKTFSEEVNTASDLSNAVDATFTTNTVEERTCISVHRKEDERISEISEPDWGSTTSQNQNDLNSLVDVPSLDVLTEDERDDDDCDNDCELQHDDEAILEQQNSDGGSFPSDENVEATVRSGDGQQTIIQNVVGGEDAVNVLQSFLSNEVEHSSTQYYNTFTASSANSETAIEDNAKENLNPNVTSKVDGNKLQHMLVTEKSFLCDTPALTSTNASELTKHQHHQLPSAYNVAICEPEAQFDSDILVEDEIFISRQLSGEEDPWAQPLTDIRFNGPCTEMMSTSFTVNEWESDEGDDDSNSSSEEFMYVKGTPEQSAPQREAVISQKFVCTQPEIIEEAYTSEEDVEQDAVWGKHQDKVPVGSLKPPNTELKPPSEAEQSDSATSDVEEFVPSCWDSMATPARSALKSPDKSSSEEENKCISKKRRNVAFKKQRYHSVYEYPKELATLSPAYSEPQIWQRDINSLVDFDDEEPPPQQQRSKYYFDRFDGFTVSSSSRPFHSSGSQFNAQCHTWPTTDMEFSWSQETESDEQKQFSSKFSELQIEWPREFGEFLRLDESTTKSENDSNRPDSGVGESAELLSESISLAECQKPCTGDGGNNADVELLDEMLVMMEEEVAEVEASSNLCAGSERSDDLLMLMPCDDDELPPATPSCTGSMDSLSSSSGSERQVSFATFGKSPSALQLVDHNNHVNSLKRHSKPSQIVSSDATKPAIILVEKTIGTDTIIKKPISIREKTSAVTNSARQSDSTDEDSGIESLMRIVAKDVVS